MPRLDFAGWPFVAVMVLAFYHDPGAAIVDTLTCAAVAAPVLAFQWWRARRSGEGRP